MAMRGRPKLDTREKLKLYKGKKGGTTYYLTAYKVIFAAETLKQAFDVELKQEELTLLEPPNGYSFFKVVDKHFNEKIVVWKDKQSLKEMCNHKCVIKIKEYGEPKIILVKNSNKGGTGLCGHI